MKEWVKKIWPLVLACALLWVTILVLLVLVAQHNQGHLVYTLDDPYIHMAIAKNLVQHGTWSIDGHGFTSTSSSPLWVLLLAGTYVIFGINELSPLILNFIFATSILATATIVLQMYRVSQSWIFFTLLSIIFIAKIPSLVLCGQEHLLHASVTLLFVSVAVRDYSDTERTRRRSMPLFFLTLLLPAIRYEGMFLVFVVGVMFALKRNYTIWFRLWAAAAFSVIVYGGISIYHGSLFFPNPLLLNGNMPRLYSWNGILQFLSNDAFRWIISEKNITVKIVLACVSLVFLWGWRSHKHSGHQAAGLLAVFIATALLQLQFGKVGGPFLRYGAYLITFGIVCMSISIYEQLQHADGLRVGVHQYLKRLVISAGLIVCVASFWYTAGKVIPLTIQAANNIYEQQYQMGLFLKWFYADTPVAVNDIGAVNYYSNIRCLDLYGLANVEITKAMMNGTYDVKQIDTFARKDNVELAMVYDSWYSDKTGGLPPQWKKVGSWTIAHNVTCGDSVVSFYAVNPQAETRLIANLRAFSSQLPLDISQTGLYAQK